MLRLVQRKVCRLVSLVTLVILVSSQATVQAIGDRTPESLARQGKQLGISEPEQKYDLDISFPIDADEAVNDEGRRERIDELIQAILNDEELVSVCCIFLCRFPNIYVHLVIKERPQRRFSRIVSLSPAVG